MPYISPPLICARSLGMNQGRFKTETIREVQWVDIRWFERLINAPLKGVPHLTISLVVIIVWRFMNRGGMHVVVGVGIRSISHSLIY